MVPWAEYPDCQDILLVDFFNSMYSNLEFKTLVQ